MRHRAMLKRQAKYRHRRVKSVNILDIFIAKISCHDIAMRWHREFHEIFIRGK